MVGDQTYQVIGSTVSPKDGGSIDEQIIKKAFFTARVLDEQILHSDYNKTQFGAAHRAVVYADALSERRIEPWRVPVLNATGEAGLPEAKAQFKEWVGKVVNDPRELALAIARKDTLDGIAAYRENAIIYRKITKRNGILTYDEAMQFTQNQSKILRMAFARAMEERLANGDGKAPESASDKPGTAPGEQRQAGGPQSDANKGDDPAAKDGQNKDGQSKSGDSAARADGKEDLKQKVQSEVIDKLDKDVKTPEDLDHSYDKLRDIVTAESTDLQNNRDLQDYARSTDEIRTVGERQIVAYHTPRIRDATGGAAPPQMPVFHTPVIRMTYTPPPRYTSRPVAVRHLQRGVKYSFGGKHRNPQSTITGEIKSNYRPVTRQAAQTIIGKYKSIPGGVTLEGSSADLAGIRSVTYDAKTGAFIVDNDLVYLSPIGIDEFGDIARALGKDDKLGVSLGTTAIIYGELSPQGTVVANLKLLDKFLAAIAFGNRGMIPEYRFAPGYVGERTQGKHLAVYFNVHDFRFTADDSGELKRSGVSLDTTLVPLMAVASADGRHRPDFDRIDRSDVPAAYAANLKNMQDNIEYYARERVVRRVIAYGEAAAFSRALRDNKVQTDLATWSPGVATLLPATAPAPSAGGDAGTRASNGDCAVSAVHWSSSESLGTRAAFEDHLQRFPNCPFATLAAARIAALDQKTSPPIAAERERPARAKRQAAAPRRAAASEEAPSTRGALDCSRPDQLFACANRALGTSPLAR